MRKNSVFNIFLFVSMLTVTSLAFPFPVFAHHQKQVLGTSAVAPAPKLPPTVEGPGLVLPDSPLYFLDQFKQNARIFFAFTPELKAKVYTNIAGERMAELRNMAAKNNKTGVEKALVGISDNLEKAAQEISNAQLAGINVSTTAKEVNDSIKSKQQTLDIFEAEATGTLKEQIQAVNEAVLVSKVTVEDALPEDMLANEIRDDLKRKIQKRIENAADSSLSIEYELEVLEQLASESAKESLLNRQMMILEAIEAKDVIKKAQLEKELEAEKKKQDELLKVQESASEEARKAIEAAQKAAAQLQKAETVRNKSTSDYQKTSTTSGNTSTSSDTTK